MRTPTAVKIALHTVFVPFITSFLFDAFARINAFVMVVYTVAFPPFRQDQA